jgi:uncharacterized protein DUF6893
MSKAAALVAAAGVGALVYSQLPELRRYMKIRQM